MIVFDLYLIKNYLILNIEILNLVFLIFKKFNFDISVDLIFKINEFLLKISEKNKIFDNKIINLIFNDLNSLFLNKK
jgi:hypothetical protein